MDNFNLEVRRLHLGWMADTAELREERPRSVEVLERALRHADAWVIRLVDLIDGCQAHDRGGVALEALLAKIGADILTLGAYVDAGPPAVDKCKAALADLHRDALSALSGSAPPPPVASAHLSFLPMSLEAMGVPMTAEDVVCKLTGSPRGIDLYMNDAGKVQWRHGGRALTRTELAKWSDMARQMPFALAVLRQALADGDLKSYVHNRTGDKVFCIPRHYWAQRGDAALYAAFAGLVGARDNQTELVGQGISFSSPQVEAWLSIGRQQLDLLVAPITGNDNAPGAKQTNKKPDYYPQLRTEFEKHVARREKWKEAHPNDLPPNFPTAATFGRFLKNKGWSAIPPETVRYHVRALKQEFGIVAQR